MHVVLVHDHLLCGVIVHDLVLVLVPDVPVHVPHVVEEPHVAVVHDAMLLPVAAVANKK